MTTKIPDELRHFAFGHLPEDLQKVSQPFYSLAYRVWENTENCSQRSHCLQKLLEAKDCAVRAALDTNFRPNTEGR